MDFAAHAAGWVGHFVLAGLLVMLAWGWTLTPAGRDLEKTSFTAEKILCLGPGVWLLIGAGFEATHAGVLPSSLAHSCSCGASL